MCRGEQSCFVATAFTSPSLRPITCSGGERTAVISGPFMVPGTLPGVPYASPTAPHEDQKPDQTGPFAQLPREGAKSYAVLAYAKRRGQTGFFQTLRFGPVLLVASCKTGRRCYYKYVSGAACRLDMVCPAGPHLFFKGQQFDCWPFALPRPSIAKLESFREETPSIPQVRPLANSEWTRCREAS